jgi:hypothetical protein
MLERERERKKKKKKEEKRGVTCRCHYILVIKEHSSVLIQVSCTLSPGVT